jgi:hypothetical protein
MSAALSFSTVPARLRRTPWRHLAGYAYLALFALLLVRWMAPDAMGPALRKLGLALPLVLLAAKDLSHAPDALRRLRAATGWRDRITALLPPELLGMFRLDRLMWLGFVQWARGRAPASPAREPDGIALTYLQRGAYGTAVAVAMVALFLELPIDFLILNLAIDEPQTRLFVHIIGGIGAFYSFVWVLADRWHVGAGSHVLTGDMLHLQVGVRSQGSIPLSMIERCDLVAEAPERWRRRHGIHQADTLLVTPFDKPNCVLVLAPDAEVTILHWQVSRRAPRYVLLYLDRPELLASRLRLAIQ